MRFIQFCYPKIKLPVGAWRAVKHRKHNTPYHACTRTKRNLHICHVRLKHLWTGPKVGKLINNLYAFLLMFNSNLWRNSAPLQDIRLRNLSDLEFDLSMSLNGKCDSVIGLLIYAFLLMFNSNIWCISARLQDIYMASKSCQVLCQVLLSSSLRELDFDLSRSLKIKCDGVIGLSTYGFLLMYIITACLPLTV